MSIEISSTAFDEGQVIPKRHTEDGEDLSPALRWPAAPKGTAEFALIVDDPDAPTKEPWVHWVLYKIPSNSTGLPEGFHGATVPAGLSGLIQGINTWGTPGYRGPAPPRGHGTHHYYFKLLALDAVLNLPAGLTKNDLLEAVKGHVLAEGELVGVYER